MRRQPFKHTLFYIEKRIETIEGHTAGLPERTQEKWLRLWRIASWLSEECAARRKKLAKTE